MAAQATWACKLPAVSESDELCGNGLPRIIGNSAGLQRVLGMVRMVAPTDSTVLINGETGTGK